MVPVTIRRDWQDDYRLDYDSEDQVYLPRRPSWLNAFYYLYGKRRDLALVEQAARPDPGFRLLIDVDDAPIVVEGVCEMRYSWGVVLDAETDGVKVHLILQAMEDDARMRNALFNAVNTWRFCPRVNSW